VVASSTKAATPRTTPKTSPAAGDTRPLATGRFAVRCIARSMSRSITWLIAPAPPAESAPPRQVSPTRASDGSPATYIVVTVVKSSSDCTLGLVISK
jgi:hypothetical protein